MLVLLSLLSPALAGEGSFFVGGGLALRPSWEPAAGFAFGGEAEADLQFGVGALSGRFDLDFNAMAYPTPGIVTVNPDVPVIDTIRPEWAMIQYAPGQFAARGGILNAAFGLEDWDDWALYLPSHAQYFAYSPGRLAGSEFAWTFGDGGPSVAIGGGWDLDYDQATVEANVTYSGDAFATWSGVAWYPADDHVMAVLGAEAYPAEVVTLALGGVAGVDAGSPFVDVSLYGVFLPEAMVSPAVRVEGAWDPDGVTGAVPFAAGAGGAIKPTDWIKVLVEGKALVDAAGDVSPGVYASLCVYRVAPPEPE